MRSRAAGAEVGGGGEADLDAVRDLRLGCGLEGKLEMRLLSELETDELGLTDARDDGAGLCSEWKLVVKRLEDPSIVAGSGRAPDISGPQPEVFRRDRGCLASKTRSSSESICSLFRLGEEVEEVDLISVVVEKFRTFISGGEDFCFGEEGLS